MKVGDSVSFPTYNNKYNKYRPAVMSGVITKEHEEGFLIQPDDPTYCDGSKIYRSIEELEKVNENDN